MRKEDLLKKILIIIVENFNWLNDKIILPEDRLREDLGLDSLGMVNLQVSIEDEFGIRFDPVETDLTEVFNTINSLIEFVYTHVLNNRKIEI